RHTRCYRDWSSDVCSSDLDGLTLAHFFGVLFLGQVLGQPGIEFDSRRFELIGAAVKEDVACAMTKASGITSLEKWMAATTPVKLDRKSGGEGKGGSGAWDG